MFVKKKFNNIFIIDDRAHWSFVSSIYDSSKDLILTFDFGLHKEISDSGGQVFFIDHLCDQDVMQEENKNIYKYFNRWHLDSEGKDIFTYHGLDFGFVFRQEIWNDFTYTIRLFLALEVVKTISCNKIYMGSSDQTLIRLMNYTNITYEKIDKHDHYEKEIYFFPMSRWMDEAIRPKDLKAKIRVFLYFVIPWILYYFHRINVFSQKKPLVFVQNYHPTKAIIERLNAEGKVYLCVERFSNYTNWKSYFTERAIPLKKISSKHEHAAKKLIAQFADRKSERLVLNNGSDITGLMQEVFIDRLIPRLPYYVSLIDSITWYFSKNKLNFEILVSNVGIFNGLVHAYCQQNGIVNYLIINGFLGDDFTDEGKYGMIINSYSTSVKKNFYENGAHVVTLGDPRMDLYVKMGKKIVNRTNPTITIGTSNFNNVDLNSYSAEEFDFLYDILLVVRNKMHKDTKLIIKVRANGYKYQYEHFVEEYFPDLKIELFDTIPMIQVLQRTDFYITIYSQTLFEASVMGTPSVYYKKDLRIMHTPFDGTSELVTANTISELEHTFDDFHAGSDRFNQFSDYSVMAKYIGPLDGKNLDRNMHFIYRLLECSNEKEALKIASEVRT
jgi:hypothetical protein